MALKSISATALAMPRNAPSNRFRPARERDHRAVVIGIQRLIEHRDAGGRLNRSGDARNFRAIAPFGKIGTH
jgi:hypothetical protein